MTNIVHLGDCMEGMAQYPNKWFDLAVVDPPYGIGRDGSVKTTSKHGGRKAHEFKGWDKKTPDALYFNELFRVSKNQVIWGANYFSKYLPASMGWIFWDKGQRICNSDGELAFTSFDCALRVYEQNRCILLTEGGTIHPTQKPAALYDWIFKNYLPNGGKVLDTHVGSGSSRISAYKRGNIDFTGWELDPDYHRDQEARFREFVMKVAPAELEPITKDGQIKLF